MILGTKSRRSIVLTAGGNRRIVKRFDGRAMECGESDMSFRDRTLSDPEIRPVRSQADSFAEVHQDLVPNRRQRGLKETFTFRNVGDCQTDMIEHDLVTSAGSVCMVVDSIKNRSRTTTRCPSACHSSATIFPLASTPDPHG